ncbi:type II toxin-antitoxin system RelE/ParE family toxin [uncultured Sphingomonas sp.]|uniref:type II toxin-antitoxin system RelE/ParE family toxin n=1 Tax=uncultured Sphingomonas sp. TaxID=158754 RepID=UPI0035C96525
MARRALILSRRASIEHEEIAAFSLQRFGHDVADSYMAGLDAVCERLCDFPELAPIDPRVRPETRSLHHRSHRILYIVEPTHILIVRILHQARATPTAL